MDVKFNIKIDPSLLKMSKNLVKGVVKGLAICGDLVENEIRKLEVYIDRTGMLRRSTKRQKVNEKELSVDIIAGMEYGKYVNDGTRYITARQFMEIGLEKASKSFESIIGKSIIREI